MHDKVFSCVIDGLTPKIIEVETDISNGLPSFSIVGLGDASVQEAKERVRSALKNSGAKFPPLRKTTNLAPANIRKHGPSFDLPIAVSILAASDQIPKEELKEALFVGELSLNGKLRSVRGILPIVSYAAQMGFKKIYLPRKNAGEGSLVESIKVMPISNIKELIGHFYKGNLHPHKHQRDKRKEQENIYDFKFIKGMDREKRILEIAAAGGHHILMQGPPGSGKTVLARTFQTILPELPQKDSLEVTSIYSIAGFLTEKEPLIVNSPFREVHHSATESAILGGGGNIKPGEITLAHKGVVFFDELSEFSSKIIESLRKPLEDKEITIQRTANKLTLPADFIFIGALNPCPCGFYGDGEKECKCSLQQIKRYQKKLSGPFLDRIDVFLQMKRVKFERLIGNKKEEDSKEIKKRVEAARGIQLKRQNKINSKLKSHGIKENCKLKKESKILLKKAIITFGISTRGLLKTLKIARTIADLENVQSIKLEHITEALQYREFNEHS